jgi:hypothetical protein
MLLPCQPASWQGKAKHTYSPAIQRRGNNENRENEMKKKGDIVKK